MRRSLAVAREYLRHPAQLGLNFWLHDPRQLTTADGAAVTSLPDSGPNAVAAVTGTAAPTMGRGANGINGVPALIYNGSTQNLLANAVAASFSGTDLPCTMFHVGVLTTGGGSGVTQSLGRAASSTPSHRLRFSTGNFISVTRTDDAATSKALSANGGLVLVGVPYVAMWRFNGQVGDLWLNGQRASAETDFDVGATTLDKYSIGARSGASTVNFHSGLIGISGILAGWLQDSQARQLCHWLMRIYRIGD